jgi:uncharacterized membrane protein YgcG
VKRFVALVLLAVAARAGAQERISSYDSQIQINRDGSLDVTENITVHAEGNQIRRGIYRDFPTRYKDRFGNRVVVALDVLSVQKNDVVEPWFTERMSNGVRINTGNDDFLVVPADYKYTLHYKTTRQLGFFEDHDELYWNAIGAGWVFPVEKGSVEVRLPVPVAADSMKLLAFTGPPGAQGNAYTATIPEPGVARFDLSGALAPYEAFTVVVGFPKGIVPAPTSADRARNFFQDNLGVLVALAGLILLWAYMYRSWSRVGRDPKQGIIIARYEPSVEHSAAGYSFMSKMKYDMRAFTADVLTLAVNGHLKVHENEKMFKNEWQLERVHNDNAQPISEPQRLLLETLFRSGDVLVLKNKNATTMQAARDGHKKMLERQYVPQFFTRNPKQNALAWFIGIGFGIVSFITSRGFGIPAIIAIGAIAFISLCVYGYLIKAPTRDGRALLDEIEGFKLYMGVAEKQELASMKGPDEPVLDAERYEMMLPYAVALEVEDAWTSKFTAAAGAAAVAEAQRRMTWYGGQGPITNLGSFTNSIGNGLSSSISSASTPPGSSSGFGGGGGAGGGGGGGGGGGR